MAGTVGQSHGEGGGACKEGASGEPLRRQSIPSHLAQNIAIPGHEDVVVGRAAHLACVSSQNTRLGQLACHSPIWPLLACSTPSK
jgi:hypothetical protein